MRLATSRFARSALLLGGSAALAVALAVATTPRFARAKIPPLDSLPWASVGRLEAPNAPLAVLYVQSRCTHCSGAAAAFDSIARNAALQVVMITSDSAPAADAYRTRLSLRHPIALDTTRAMMRALRLQSVPTLIVFSRDGSRHLVVGFRGASAYRSLLRSLE